MAHDRQAGSGFVELFGGAMALLAVGVLSAELLCRLVAPIYLFNPDRARDVQPGERYSRLRANHRIVSSTAGEEIDYTTNSDGYRDLEFPRGHPCLVLAFGNSFAVNWGVHPDAGWPRRLEARLGAHPDARGCAVRSVALQGWDVRHAYEAAQDMIPALRPRVVLLLFTQMWSRSAPNLRRLGEPSPEPPEVPQKRARRPTLARTLAGWAGRAYNAVERHSALLGAVRYYVPYLPASLGVTQMRIADADQDLAPMREQTLAALDGLADLAEEADARFVLAIGPSIYEVDKAYLYLLLAARGGSDRGVSIEEARHVLFAWARRRGVPAVDLRPALLQAQQRARVYSPVDVHWNQRGNRLVAETLAPELLQALGPVSGARTP